MKKEILLFIKNPNFINLPSKFLFPLFSSVKKTMKTSPYNKEVFEKHKIIMLIRSVFLSGVCVLDNWQESNIFWYFTCRACCMRHWFYHFLHTLRSLLIMDASCLLKDQAWRGQKAVAATIAIVTATIIAAITIYI